MSYKVSFLDNQSVTAQDLNDIGEGMPNVSYQTFQDGTPYGVDDLNDITASLMNPGVAKNYGLMCSTSISNGVVHINAGRAFFASGATITVDNSGIDLTVPESNQMQYVYFFYSANGNIAGAKIAETKAETDTVELATISANGTLTDTRQYAYNKNASILPNQYYDDTITIGNGITTVDVSPGYGKIIVERRVSDESKIASVIVIDALSGKAHVLVSSNKAPYAYFTTENYTPDKDVGYIDGCSVSFNRDTGRVTLKCNYRTTVHLHCM